MAADWLLQFLDAKYISLETYKKNGEAVRTPVWFVINNDTIYVATLPTAGKVRRLGHNKGVRLVPCNFRGKPRGSWVSATAYSASEAESEQAIGLRNKKYGIMARLVGMAAYRKGPMVVIGIKA